MDESPSVRSCWFSASVSLPSIGPSRRQATNRTPALRKCSEFSEPQPRQGSTFKDLLRVTITKAGALNQKSRTCQDRSRREYGRYDRLSRTAPFTPRERQA